MSKSHCLCNKNVVKSRFGAAYTDYQHKKKKNSEKCGSLI